MKIRRITRRSKEVKWAKAWLKSHGIRHRFKWGTACGGGFFYAGPRGKERVEVHMTTRGERVGSRVSVQVDHFLSTLFHETAHAFSFREGKFRLFHQGKHPSHMKPKELRAFLRTALIAERHTDARGAKLMKQHFPKMSFYGAYSRTWTVNWFNREWLEPYRFQLRLRRL